MTYIGIDESKEELEFVHKLIETDEITLLPNWFKFSYSLKNNGDLEILDDDNKNESKDLKSDNKKDSSSI